jgi:hypothetical protein
MESGVLKQHQALMAVAVKQNCTSSSLEEGNVSMHTLPETASFSNVDALARAAEPAEAYIGTSAGDLVFSVHLAPAEADADEPIEPPPKKRRRTASAAHGEQHNDREIAAARARLEKSVPELQRDELDVAQKAMSKLVNELRGPEGEVVVQSTAMLAKKLAPDDARQRVVLAARLNAGIAMRVDALRGCLGDCWADGLLTTQPTLHGVGKLELPLSEEAKAASHFGNATILLVTSVAAK